jgi:TolB protein
LTTVAPIIRATMKLQYPLSPAPRRSFQPWVLLASVLALAAVCSADAVHAQEEQEAFPGVALGLLYESAYRPTVAVKPFTSRFGGESLAAPTEAIIGRDLRYSDRFEILENLPPELLGEGVDYRLWDQLGADWLVVGQVEAVGEDYVLVLQLHDIVDGTVEQRGRIPLPPEDHPDFRLTVHVASDLLVRWITGEPGMAASRIVFAREVQTRDGDYAKELFVVDSDGEGLRRLTSFGDITLSPSFSPDGTRVLFTSTDVDAGVATIYEMDLETGTRRALNPNRGGQPVTPEYHPNGREIAFSLMDGNRSGLFTYDFGQNCCLTHLTGGRWNDVSPTYSPDGTRIAFNSNRLGTAIPQIYVMSARGGEADLVSPYVYGRGGYYTSPDWSPTGERIAFHGRIRRGRYHILVADVRDRGGRVIQLTSEGNNEDPSWAPDGRHIVFVGERNWGYGLFVVDAVTGRLRLLAGGVRASVPDWSPGLSVEGLDALQAQGF